MGDDKSASSDFLIGLISTGAAIAAASIANRAIKEGWRKVRKEEPPEDPESEDVSWTEASVWTLTTSAVLGLVKLVVKKGPRKRLRK